MRIEVLDLFSGIGGFSLAAHSVGFDTAAFCEIDPYCQKVLRRHFPGVPIFDDVKELTADALADAAGVRRDGDYPDDRGSGGAATTAGRPERMPQELNGQSARGRDALILTAGFPCQDISYAGKGAGLAGERSGLFYEVARLVGELRPDYALLENVAGLLTRGIDAVLGTLASLGYDALWACIPACAVGAPHRRDRVWILAAPEGTPLTGIYERVLSGLTPFGDVAYGWPTATASDWKGACASEVAEGGNGRLDNVVEGIADAGNPGSLNPAWVETLMGYPIGYTLPDGDVMRELPNVWPAGLGAEQHEWEPPRLTSVKENRADRLKALGNSIVPQVARLWLDAIREENAPATCEGVQACDDVQPLSQVAR